MTVRNLDPGVKAKLRERAARNGRSMEAEVRVLLTDAVSGDAEPTNLVASIRKHFADDPVELELPDRSASLQRPVKLDS